VILRRVTREPSAVAEDGELLPCNNVHGDHDSADLMKLLATPPGVPPTSQDNGLACQADPETSVDAP
jgi:hypothetical protein